MVLKKPAFTRTKLDEEERPDIITIRLNPADRKELDKFKKKTGERKDSTAFKNGFQVGANEIHSKFSGNIQVRIIRKNTPKAQYEIGIV